MTPFHLTLFYMEFVARWWGFSCDVTFSRDVYETPFLQEAMRAEILPFPVQKGKRHVA